MRGALTSLKAATNVRRRLAERTRDVHEALHGHPVISLLLSSTLTRAQYDRLLGAFYGYLVGAEARRAANACWSDLSLARPIARLRDDLSPLDSAAAAADLKWVDDPLSTLAVLYVLHGSAFGGSVIAKRVGRTLPDAPTAYLSAGADVVQWRRLVSALDEHASHPQDFETIVRSARRGFSQFGQWVSAFPSVARLG